MEEKIETASVWDCYTYETVLALYYPRILVKEWNGAQIPKDLLVRKPGISSNSLPSIETITSYKSLINNRTK